MSVEYAVLSGIQQLIAGVVERTIKIKVIFKNQIYFLLTNKLMRL